MSREIKFRAWTKDHWINDGMINATRCSGLSMPKLSDYY
jgi:hypothetical protein